MALVKGRYDDEELMDIQPTSRLNASEESRSLSPSDSDAAEDEPRESFLGRLFRKPAKKEAEPEKYDQRVEDHKNHRAIVVGLLKERVIWRSGESCLDNFRDWWFFACQNHPLLSMCFAHPLHPFSRLDRWCHLFAMLFFSFFMAALVEVEHNDEEEDHFIWLLVANISILVLDYVLRILSTCECIQPGGPCECCVSMCGENCKEDCLKSGRLQLRGILVINLLLCMAGIVMVAEDSETDFSEYLETWLVIKVLSYTLLFIVTIAHFLYSRKAEKPSWAEAKLSSKYPYPGYPKPEYFKASWTLKNTDITSRRQDQGAMIRARSKGDLV